MESKIAKALKLKRNPIAIPQSDRESKDAVQFKESKWGVRNMDAFRSNKEFNNGFQQRNV